MTRVIVTATGAGSVVAPYGAYAVDVEAWGGGGSGNREGFASLVASAGAGAYAGSFGIPIGAGQNLFWSVGIGGAALTTASASGRDGAQSWIRVLTNAAPSSSIDGALAAPGKGPPSAGVAGNGGTTALSIGTLLHKGGSGVGEPLAASAAVEAVVAPLPMD